MLQRIQTIYLFLVFVFGLLYLFLPLATVVVGDASYILKPYELKAPGSIAEGVDVSLFRVFLLIVLFSSMVIAIVTTFKYRKRLLQIKLGKLNILLLLILVVLSFFYIDSLKEQLSANVSYGVGIFFPFVSMLLILLANRLIRKDEELVRSIDRIR